MHDTIRRIRRYGIGLLASAALVIPLATATAAQAEEHHFCWGANIGPGGGCESGSWTMTGAYANSSANHVCLNLSGISACTSNPNEGVYISGNGTSQRALIFNEGNGYTIQVYGEFWT
jgi:hypothetical protein